MTASGPQRGVVSDFARFQRIAELIQIAQDRELAFIHSEERLKDMGEPRSAEAVPAAAEVEAAKSGMEYRATEDGKSACWFAPGAPAGSGSQPGCRESPGSRGIDGLAQPDSRPASLGRDCRRSARSAPLSPGAVRQNSTGPCHVPRPKCTSISPMEWKYRSNISIAAWFNPR